VKKTTVLLCLAGVVLAGCGGSSPKSAGPSAPNPDTLQWGIVGVNDVPTLDPALVSDPTSMTVASLVYGGLVRLDRRLRVRPDGAQRWTISPDGRVYTFYLRPKLRYADGRRVVAADFAAAINRALGPEGSAGAASFYLSSIAQQTGRGAGVARTTRGITVLNQRTLRIRLARPSAHFLAELAFPASFVEEPSLPLRYGANWTDHAAGFGPYRVASWRHTQYLRLVRNPYYWAGRPALRALTLHFYSKRGALAAYRRGALDVISGLQAGETLDADPGGLIRVPALALDYLAFNTDRLPFHRLRARWAFASVVTAHLLRGTEGNGAFPGRGLLPPGLGLSVPRWSPDHSPRSYLSAARYPDGKGFPPIVLVTPRGPGVRDLAIELARAWRRQLAVTVQVRPLDLSSYNEVLSKHDFDIALVRWGADYPDPQDFLGTQLGASADNVTGWSTRRYNTDVFLADSYAPSDARRIQLFRQAALLATRKLPLLPLDIPAISAVIRPGLRGLSLTGMGTVVGAWTKVGFTGR
jgi:oligopeptide transport system substrate-binding protein